MLSPMPRHESRRHVHDHGGGGRAAGDEAARAPLVTYPMRRGVSKMTSSIVFADVQE